MRSVVVLILLMVSLNALSDDYECVSDYVDKKLVFAFNDGDIDYLRFVKNQYGVVTANYYVSGREIINRIKVYCYDYSDEVYLSSDNPSPAGPYKKPVKIYLPTTIESGVSQARIDLRWGRFYSPYPRIFLE